MTEKTNWLHDDHRKYERALQECRDLAEAEDWKNARRVFDDFASHLKVHILMEEEILYPEYEQTENGIPLQMIELRRQHDDITRLLRDLSQVIRINDADHFLPSLVPLESILRRHHQDEEEHFLPAAGKALLPRREEVLKKLQAFVETHGGGTRA